MGKIKKSNKHKIKHQNQHSLALEKQIENNKKAKKPKLNIVLNEVKDDIHETSLVNSGISHKILVAAKKQHLEITNEYQNDKLKTSKKPKTHVSFAKDLTEYQDDDFPDTKFDDDDDDGGDADDDINEDQLLNELSLNPDDLKALELFQSSAGNTKNKTSKNLADIIQQKIHEKQNDLESKFLDTQSIQIQEIHDDVKEMYERVRDVMKRYRSGKIPKAFKIIPKLRNWEQILYLTEPHNWSAAALYQGTRMFCSVLSEQMTQRFYNLVLLPRIRDDLNEYKKLNIHLYNALKKAIFKPAAFMKGIILPLLELNGNCTLREAIIIGSIIAKRRIPVLHSSACLLKICEMEYTGANSIFIRIFLDKRYALPYRVIDACVHHFIRFGIDRRVEMPVLWHQSLLTFVQRYKNDISSEQRDALLELLYNHFHHKITPDIRRELQAAKCRDIEVMETI